jgi:hypothetical protein
VGVDYYRREYQEEMWGARQLVLWNMRSLVSMETVPRRDQQSNMAERSAGYKKPTLHALLGSDSHHTYFWHAETNVRLTWADYLNVLRDFMFSRRRVWRWETSGIRCYVVS